MEEKQKKHKRIRYPKKNKETQEEKKHYVLNVHNVEISNKSKIGN